MALMTAKEYIDSLRKLNTRVYMFGEKIDNWVDHPMIRPSRQQSAERRRFPAGSGRRVPEASVVPYRTAAQASLLRQSVCGYS